MNRFFKAFTTVLLAGLLISLVSCAEGIKYKEKIVYSTALPAGTYTVYHYQQKTTGGNSFADYTLESSESEKTVAANTMVDDLKKSYDGFSAAAMSQNGSAVYVFYDRNIITYTFNSGDKGNFGEGKQSATVKGLYGASCTPPANPDGELYGFVKWLFNGEAAVIPSEFGLENLTFTAAWKYKTPKGFVRITAGSFQMGCTGNYCQEKPVHKVTLTRDYYIADHEVTQTEFTAVMNSNPSHYSSDPADDETQVNRPVEKVSWYKAIVYCNKRSINENLEPCYKILKSTAVAGSTDPQDYSTNPDEWGDIPTTNNDVWNAVKLNLDASGYRLPLEAEWEYAARAGQTDTSKEVYSGTADFASLTTYAWTESNSGGKTHEVKKKSPNGYNIYDMSGNVVEWCWDWASAMFNYDSSGADETDPTGIETGEQRIVRGGSVDSVYNSYSVSGRLSCAPSAEFSYVGFRLVRTANIE